MITINDKQLDLTTGELHQNNQVTQLEPKVLAVFIALYQAKGQLVTQQALLEQIWPESIVAPNALQRCITQLRKHLGDTDKSLIQTFPKKGYRLCLGNNAQAHTKQINKPRALVLMLLLAVCTISAIALIYSLKVPKQQPSIASIRSITYAKQPQFLGRHTKGYYAYVERTDESEQLQLFHITSQHTKTLLKKPHFYSAPSFSPNGKTIAISIQATHSNKTKCSQVTIIHIPTHAQQNKGPCTAPFTQQVHWLNDELLLLRSGNQLHTLAINSGDHLPISLPTRIHTLTSVQKITHDTLLIAGYDANNKSRVWQVALEHNNAQITHILELAYDAQHTSMIVLDKHHQIHSANNTLYFYRDFKLVSQQTVHGYNKITLEDVIHERALLATQSYQDFDIIERHFKNEYPEQFDDITHASSEFIEQDGQYQPNGQHIALLSSRSGNMQIWLTGEQPHQLTFAQPVDNFVWQQDGSALWFLSEQTLNKVTLDGRLIHFPMDVSLSQLFQHRIHNGEHYLLAAELSTGHLLQVNLNTGKSTKLLADKTDWAQQSSTGQLFVAINGIGKLKQLLNHSLNDVRSFSDKQLQWRFYYREGLLLVPTKSKAIWAYNPKSQHLQIVGYFDKATYLASDITAQPFSMLTTSPSEHRANLVKVLLN